MSTEYFLDLARNNAWANATLLGSCAALTDQAFVAERPGFFPSLFLTLNHIHEVDLYYLDALEVAGLGRSIFDTYVNLDAAALAQAQRDADLRLIGFCRKLDAGILSQPRVLARRAGPVHERIDMILLHLFQHQVHHRGQAHAMLTHAGVAPPPLDEFFLENDRIDSASQYWTV